MKTYEQYTVQLMGDPSNYGSECTEEDAKLITCKMEQMIVREFPGIETRVWQEAIGGSAATRGPDPEVCQEIDEWISDNWTAAL